MKTGIKCLRFLIVVVLLWLTQMMWSCTTIRSFHPLTVTAVTDTLYRVRGSMTGTGGGAYRFETWLTPEELELYYVDRYAPDTVQISFK
jgi:hypothetical protein